MLSGFIILPHEDKHIKDFLKTSLDQLIFFLYSNCFMLKTKQNKQNCFHVVQGPLVGWYCRNL